MISHRLFHLDGEEVLLSGPDFALLKLFLDHPQQILDRDTIANATRGREVMPLERIVDMAVSPVRQRLFMPRPANGWVSPGTMARLRVTVPLLG